MAGSRKRPADFTGRQAEVLAEKARAEQEARAAQVTMVTAAAAAEASETVDYAGPAVEEIEAEDGTVIEVEQPTRVVRVNTTIEQLTFGHGNFYDFEEGREYRVPAALADHLEEKGFVWH